MGWFVLCMGLGRSGDRDAFVGSDEDSGVFHNEVRSALQTLAKRPRGKLLINVISELVTDEFNKSQTDKRIKIRPAGQHGGQAGSGWSEELWLLQWNPEPWKPDQCDDPEGNFDQLKGIPPHIILGHELIHASHSLMNQTNYTQPGHCLSLKSPHSRIGQVRSPSDLPYLGKHPLPRTRARIESPKRQPRVLALSKEG